MVRAFVAQVVLKQNVKDGSRSQGLSRRDSSTIRGSDLPIESHDPLILIKGQVSRIGRKEVLARFRSHRCDPTLLGRALNQQRNAALRDASSALSQTHSAFDSEPKAKTSSSGVFLSQRSPIVLCLRPTRSFTSLRVSL